MALETLLAVLCYRTFILNGLFNGLNFMNIRAGVMSSVCSKEIANFHPYISPFVFSLGPRLGKASGLLRPGTSWVCDEDSTIRHGRRLDRHDRGCS